MPKFYVKWWLSPEMTATIHTLEERVKLWLSMLEMIEADIRAGVLKDWGACADLSGGYGIVEVASEADLYTFLLKWIPYVNFDARPVITARQTIESLKKAAAAAKAK